MTNKLLQLKQIIEIKPENYLQAKTQSQEIDRLLGFRCEEVEKSIPTSADGKINWAHLHVQADQTPYSELLEICRYLQPSENQTFLDIGAGYCRLGIILQIYYPLTNFIGYELVPQRIEEAKRVFQSLQLNEGCLLAKMWRKYSLCLISIMRLFTILAARKTFRSYC